MTEDIVADLPPWDHGMRRKMSSKKLIPHIISVTLNAKWMRNTDFVKCFSSALVESVTLSPLL